MLVDRSDTDGAAAGERDPGVPQPCYQRAKHQDAGTHGFDQLVGSVVDGGPVVGDKPECVTLLLPADPEVVEELAHGHDVPDPWESDQLERLVGEQRGGEGGQPGVFGATRANGAGEPIGSLNTESIHWLSVSYLRWKIATLGMPA